MIKYLLEIKNRIFLLILTIITTFLISYVYKEILLFLITQPDRLINKNASYSIFYFIFTDVTEILFIYIKLIIFLNLQVFILFIIYHCFVFFSPAMFKSEYEFLRIFLKVSLTIWVFSVLISNFFLVPITWNFFFSFQELISSKLVNLHFEAKLIEYLEFYISIYYLCVIYFQVFTIFFFFFNYINNDFKVIQKFRKMYYYFFVIFALLISPPDFISQFFITFLLIVIYEILVLILIIKKILVR